MYNKVTFFYQIVNGLRPHYFHSCIYFFLQNNYPSRSLSSDKLKCIASRTKSFSKTFFPYCIGESNKLNPEIRNVKSIYKFNKSIITKNYNIFIWQSLEWNYYHFLEWNCYHFTHFNKHKFRYHFNDTVNSMSSCGTDVETTKHFLLYCNYFSTQRSELFDNLQGWMQRAANAANAAPRNG